MAGPIAHLTVRISGQIAELQKDMKQATTAVQGFASETKKISGTVSGVASSLKGFAATVGVAFTAQAVVGFIGHVLDAASQIKDLSTQLGISTDAVQGFKFAAEQSGSSLDAVGTAIQKMNQNLSAGEKSTIGALTKAGLKFDDIRQMRPEDAFLEIADAIQKIPDPMTQAEVALRLFGRGAAELLPGIKEGFREAAEGASKMSAETIRDLEAAQDAWTALWNGVTIASGGIIGSLLKIGETTSLVLEKGVPHAVDTALLALTKMNEEMARSVRTPVVFKGGAGKAGQFTPTDSVEDILRISGEMAEASNKVAKAHRGAAKAGNEHADATKRLRDSLSGDGAIKAANEMVEALRGLPSVQHFAAEKAQLVERTMQAATEAYRQQGREVPPLIRAILLASMDMARAIPVVEGLSNEFERLGEVIAVTASETVAHVPVIAGLGSEFGRIGDITQEWNLEIRQASDGLSELAGSLTQLAQIGGSAFGSILQGLSSIVSALDAAQKANERYNGSVGIASAMFAKNATGTEKWASGLASAGAIANGAMGAWSSSANAGSKSAGALKGALSGAQAGAMFGPWGMAIGAVGGAVIGFVRNMGAGRRAVEDFAESFDTAAAGSGFDELHKRLLVLGAEGEQLWIKLTQGTKKGDTAGAQAVVSEITAALDTLKRKEAEVTAAHNTQLGALITAGQGVGTRIPEAMQPYIEQLRLAGLLTSENAAALEAMATNNSASWQQMESAANKYGIELSALGPMFQQQKLTATATDIIHTFDMLIANGADFNGVLRGMTDEINGVVRDSLKFGTEIPENMRPWIQQLIDSGDLLDESGRKITDISALKFGGEIKVGLGDVVDKLQELIDIFTDKLPNAARDGAADVRDAFRDPITIRTQIDLPEGFDVPDWDMHQSPRHLATGGIVRRRTLAIIGESGPEAVIPLKNMGLSGGHQPPIRVQVMVPDGRVLADLTVPEMPGALKRHGVS